MTLSTVILESVSESKVQVKLQYKGLHVTNGNISNHIIQFCFLFFCHFKTVNPQREHRYQTVSAFEF